MNASNESHAKAANIRKTVVLIVNDQKMICEVIRRMLLSEEDIEFHFCLEASQAVETAVEVSPTVILQDLIMPDVDGLTLLKEYRHNPKTKHIPIIVLSSEENTQIKADAFALDANDYLNKIPDKIELLARLRHHSRGYIERIEHEAQNLKLQKYKDKLMSDLIMYQRILEDLNIAFLLLSKHTAAFIVTNLNAPMEKMLHKTKAEVIGHPLSSILPQTIVTEILNAVNKVDQTETPEVLKDTVLTEWNETHINKHQSGEMFIIKRMHN